MNVEKITEELQDHREYILKTLVAVEHTEAELQNSLSHVNSLAGDLHSKISILEQESKEKDLVIHSLQNSLYSLETKFEFFQEKLSHRSQNVDDFTAESKHQGTLLL